MNSLISIPSVKNVIYVSLLVQSSNLTLYPINYPNLVYFSNEHLSARVIAATLKNNSPIKPSRLSHCYFYIWIIFIYILGYLCCFTTTCFTCYNYHLI